MVSNLTIEYLYMKKKKKWFCIYLVPWVDDVMVLRRTVGDTKLNKDKETFLTADKSQACESMIRGLNLSYPMFLMKDKHNILRITSFKYA